MVFITSKTTNHVNPFTGKFMGKLELTVKSENASIYQEFALEDLDEIKAELENVLSDIEHLKNQEEEYSQVV